MAGLPYVGNVLDADVTGAVDQGRSHTIVTYRGEPGSRSEEGLDLLSSWPATLDRTETGHATDDVRPAA